MFALIFLGGAIMATMTLSFTAEMELSTAVATVLRRIARSSPFRQLVVITCAVLLLRYGLNNFLMLLSKFSSSPVQWDKTKLYYILREVGAGRGLCMQRAGRNQGGPGGVGEDMSTGLLLLTMFLFHAGTQVYQPLELLLFIAALCTLSDAFIPALVSVPKVRGGRAQAAGTSRLGTLVCTWLLPSQPQTNSCRFFMPSRASAHLVSLVALQVKSFKRRTLLPGSGADRPQALWARLYDHSSRPLNVPVPCADLLMPPAANSFAHCEERAVLLIHHGLHQRGVQPQIKVLQGERVAGGRPQLCWGDNGGLAGSDVVGWAWQDSPWAGGQDLQGTQRRVVQHEVASMATRTCRC